jgi:hypothetical protein
MRKNRVAAIVMGSALLLWPLVFCAADDRGVDREPPLMIGEGSAPTANILDYQMWDSPGQSHGAPTMLDQRESGRFVLSRTASNAWSVNERFGHLSMGEPIAIPQTNFSVPQDLWSMEAGAGYNHHLAGGREFGLTFNVGSDSDHPFYSIHETVFRAGANYRIPSGEQNAWLFFLNYSNNRYFFNNVPLPGVGYFFKTDEDRLQGIIGFPFVSLSYRPTPDWNAQLSVFGPRNINVEISRKMIGPVRLYTAFIWNSQEWLIADRQDYSNRLFFDKKRAALGLRSPLPRGFLFDISGGRQFDQRFFVNDSSRYSDVSTAGLTPTWFIQTRLSYRFALPQN